MKFSSYFIDRPVFAAVLSAFITIAGAIALFKLPVSEYPEVVPPSVVVRAAYPGANPKIIAETVAAPLEQEIVGVEDMLYMSSQATMDGSLALTVTFRIGTDIDRAQVQVQNRVAQALPRLPEDVRAIGVSTLKSTPAFLMVVHLTSPDGRYDSLYLRNYATLNIRDLLARIPGVGDVRVFGAGDYAMRVWLDPQKMAARDLTTGDVVSSIREQNVQVAAGQVGAPPAAGSEFQLALNAKGRLENEEQFGDIVVKTGANGEVVRLRDIARLELGAATYAVQSMLGNENAVAIPVYQSPGSNALELSNKVRADMEELKKSFPQGMDYKIVYDPTQFVRQSIDAVIETLLEAVLLVVLVVILFLQTWRAAVIPLVAIPVSLIGTFFVMELFGFTLNNLSLFGLVLAIGIVVDDAIVVVENVERNIATGMSPRDAARRSMDEVGGALIAIALVLTAVFVPTAFITGISGQFYRQFALTIAGATLISLVVSLTLSPAMCALLLKPHTGHERVPWWARPVRFLFRLFNRGFDGVAAGYHWLAGRIVRIAVLMLVAYAAILAYGLNEFRNTPVGFIPNQDVGYLIGVVQLPPAASLARTDEVNRKVVDIALETPGVAHAVNIVGFSGATFTNAPNAGAVFIVLEPFEARGRDPKRSAPAIQAELFKRLSAIQEGLVLVVSPPPVRGIGTAGGVRMMIQDRAAVGSQALQGAVTTMVGKASQVPGLTQVFSLFETSTPQLYLDIDRTKAQMLSVNVSDVFAALQTYLGSTYVNDFNLLGRTFRVLAQADAPYRLDASDVLKIRVRNSNGATVPLGSFTTVRDITGPYRVPRHNLYPAAELDASPLPGTSQGQIIDVLQKLAAENLPDGIRYEWTTLAFQQQRAGNTAVFAFLLAVVFVFLVLAAQYESLTLPLAVIMIVPMCLVAAITGVILRGQDNNILTQVGFVVLIGLAAKNAILIVEFAKQLEDRGLDRWTAAAEAAQLRLRPIVMTSLAFILGVVPLVWSIGAGAELRQALGTAVFAGMIGVTLFGLLFTPAFYVLCRWLAERFERRAPATEAPQPGE